MKLAMGTAQSVESDIDVPIIGVALSIAPPNVERNIDISNIGIDLDIASLTIEEVIGYLQVQRSQLTNCTVLIGGTPSLPNSRLLAYILPAIKMAHALGQGSISISSTAMGGANWNYPDKRDQVLGLTSIKIDMIRDGLEHFFGLKTEAKANYEMPDPQTIESLWSLARIYAPALCEQYLQSALSFMNSDQNHLAVGRYGIMHAIWAGDIVSGLEKGHDLTSLSYGGSKEGAFNLVRAACLSIPDEELMKLGFAKTRNSIRIIDSSYTIPVPYGEARAKLFGKHEGPIDVPLVGEIKIGAHTLNHTDSGPFDVPKPNKAISKKILSDIHALIEYMAAYNRITIDDARQAYTVFWDYCKRCYGGQVQHLLT